MSKNLTYTLVASEEGSSLTVFRKGDSNPHPVSSTHRKWDEILAAVLADDVKALDLIHIAATAARKMLSERVSYAWGALYFDGDEIDNALSNHIIRLVEEESPDWNAFVHLMEKIYQNPSQNSREQLYKFLNANNFSITPDGDIIGYKGVYGTKDGYESSTAGPAIINGEPHKSGRVPQKDGDVVEMPRSGVDDNRNAACSRGLHVSTYQYAKGFGDRTLEVHVNPRDVVSVPADGGDKKVRVCRYRVIGAATQPHSAPVVGKREAPEIVKPVKLAKPTGKYNKYGTGKPVAAKTPKAPSQAAWDTMVDRAKRRKQNFVKFAQRNGWTLQLGQPGTSRKDWVIL